MQDPWLWSVARWQRRMWHRCVPFIISRDTLNHASPCCPARHHLMLNVSRTLAAHGVFMGG